MDAQAHGVSTRKVRSTLRRRQRARHGQLLDALPLVEPPDSRRMPDLVIDWWWHDTGRTVLLGGAVVSVLDPAAIEVGPLRFHAPRQVMTIAWRDQPPGDVERANGIDIQLTSDGWPAPETDDLDVPPALEHLLDRPVELTVAPGAEDDGPSLSRRGRLVAAITDGHHVVLILDDRTVAVVHEPVTVTPATPPGNIELAGALGRVVLDIADPEPTVEVRRQTSLHVRPIREDHA